jgi:hypothetical protein
MPNGGWGPLLPAGVMAGVRRSIHGGRWWMRSCTSCVPSVRGGRCRRISRRGRRCIGTHPGETRRVTLRMLDALREQVRLADDRDGEPSAGIIDSQSVRGAETVGRPAGGYDAVRRSTAVNGSS